MAKAKKKSAKRAAPPKKPPKSGSPAKRKAKPRVVLNKKQRQQLLKPRADFESLIEDALAKWNETPKLRVPGVTKGSLRALLHKSERAEAKEKKIQERFDKLLQPLADARRVAQSEAYRALLLLHKSAKLHGEIDPAVTKRFEFITAALRGTPAAAPADAASPVVQKATKKAARATKAAVAEALASTDAAAPAPGTNA